MLKEWRVVKTRKEWSAVVGMFSKKGFHFNYDYFDLYRSEAVTPTLIYAETEKAKVMYPFLLEDLYSHSNFKGVLEPKSCCDVTSPYGYTGPIVEGAAEKDRSRAAKLFYERFADFCSEHKVVSEFIVFSPILENYREVRDVVNVVFAKKTVSTNLQDFGDPIYGELKKGRRKDAEKCRKLGFKAAAELNPSSLEEQLKIYYETMDRNGAEDFYYFSKEYFEKMVKNLSENILVVNVFLEEKLVGFDLSFLDGEVMYSFMAGSVQGFPHCSPAVFSSCEAIKWGHENGYKYYHAGGGRTNSPDDTLYLYKKTFAKNTDHDMYLGKNIWNKDAYIYLSELAGVEPDPDSEFFPAYKRSKH